MNASELQFLLTEFGQFLPITHKDRSAAKQ